MSKRVVLSIGLVLASGAVRAQVFGPGWVLPLQGDTLRGEVEDAGWEEAPTEVRFRTGAGAAIRTLAGAEVRAFRLARGRYFRRETLPVDRAAQTGLSALTYTLKRDPHPETFLAEVLVDGPASLLCTAVKGSGQHYFVRRSGRPVLELAERRYLQQRLGGQEFIANGNNYQAELRLYFGDCPAAGQAIGRYEAAALVRVVQAYNQQCATPPQAGTEYRLAGSRLPTSFALGLATGARYSSCQLRSAGATLHGTDLDGRVHPTGGIFVDVATPGRHYALHVSALLMQLGRRATLAGMGQLESQATLIEFRFGGRYFGATTRQGHHFFVGTGLTLPYAVGTYEPTLIYYDALQRPQVGSSLPAAYPHSLLPYLEAGVQKGRLTLALDARTQLADEWTVIGYRVGAQYPLREEDYTYRSWYAGATLGVALLWQR